MTLAVALERRFVCGLVVVRGFFVKILGFI
jgi:hypothetical protein